MQVKDLSVEELKLLIKETVAETIQSLIVDPDEGKQIKPEVKQQLLQSLQRTQAGERGIPEDTVASVSSRGQQMSEILSQLAAANTFSEVNPIAWQKEVRQDRSLPDRD